VSRWPWVVGLLALGVTAVPASAQTTPGLDIRLERDPRPGAVSSALAVNVKVIVADRATGAAPGADFEVYAFADQAAGAKTEIFPCAQEHDNSPDVPRGVYVCTVLVDHGGRWRFQGVVNQLRADPDDPPVPLGRAATELDIDTTEVAPGANPNRIKARLTEVAMLWGHTAAAGAWLVAAALVMALALPQLRRRLSTAGLHRLEDRFDLIVKSLWSATGLLVASGTYLLLNQTAYDTPFSSARVNAVFRLPYGRPYFLTLAAKLAVYALMVAASAVLLREARRQLRAGVVVAPASAEDTSPWRPSRPDAPGGRTSVAIAAPVAVETPAARAAPPERAASVNVRLGALVLVSGTVALSLSITLLKYFHELIEAARAFL
jgi:hypothetical protein